MRIQTIFKQAAALLGYNPKLDENGQPLQNSTVDERPSYRIQNVYKYRVAMQMDILRDAIVQALNPVNPNRTNLISLYDQAVKDAHLKGIIRNQENIVLGQPFMLCNTKTKAPDPKRTELLARPWFDQFTRYALQASLYGHSLIQFGELDTTLSPLLPLEFSYVSLIPREYVIQEKKMFRTSLNVFTGPRYDAPPFNKWVLEVGDPFDLGLLESATRQVIFKRFAEEDWANRSERFGMPVVAIKTNENRQEELDKMEAFAANVGRNGYVIVQGTDEVEFLESKSSASASEIYEKRIDKVKEELSILILGQTMTTQDGASKSQGEVHERIMYELVEYEMRSFQQYVNFTLIPFLVKQHKYPLDGYSFVYKRFYEEFKNPATPPKPAESSQGEPGGTLEPGTAAGAGKPAKKERVQTADPEEELSF
jgi:hypothetical protein